MTLPRKDGAGGEERDMDEGLAGGVFVRGLCLEMDKTERLTNLFLPIIWVNPKEISKMVFIMGGKKITNEMRQLFQTREF